MAIHADFVFEVRTTGDDTNGGGYKSSAGTTDYSQQDVAELSLTDCATSGAGATTLTSVTGGFTAAMVGNSINLSSGTNLTAGFYEITAFTDANTVTLDRSPDDSVGGVSGATGKVGGCLGTPGALSSILMAKGNRCWIKEGTYTLTTTTAGPAGPLDLSVNNTWIHLLIEGYGTVRGDGGRPVISAGSTAPYAVVKIYGSYNIKSQAVIGVVVDGNNNSTRGFLDSSTNYLTGMFLKCKAINCGIIGFHSTGQLTQCYASGCADGMKGRVLSKCFVKDCTGVGFSDNTRPSFASDCIAQNCTFGFYRTYYNFFLVNCIADRCVSGFKWTQYDMDIVCTNCIASNCSGWGFSVTGGPAVYKSHTMNRCAGYNNTLGDVQVDSLLNHDFRSLTVDPFEDSANGNFASVSPDVRDVPGIPTQIETDVIGAVQRENAGGSTGFYYLQTFDNYTGLPQGMGESTPSMNDFKPLVSSVGNSWTTYAGAFSASDQDHTHRMRLDSADTTVYGTGSYGLNLQGFDPGLTSYRITLVAHENYSSGAVFKHDPATSTFYMMWLSLGTLRLYYFNGVNFDSPTYNTSMGVNRNYGMASIEVVGNNVKLYDDSKSLVHTETLTNNTSATGQGIVGTDSRDAIVTYYAIHEIGTDFNEIYPLETVGRQPSIPHPLYMS